MLHTIKRNANIVLHNELFIFKKCYDCPTDKKLFIFKNSNRFPDN